MAVTKVELAQDELEMTAGALIFCAGVAGIDPERNRRLIDLASRFIVRGAMAMAAERMDARRV